MPSTRQFTFSSSLKSSEVRSTLPAFTFGEFVESLFLVYRDVDRP